MNQPPPELPARPLQSPRPWWSRAIRPEFRCLDDRQQPITVNAFRDLGRVARSDQRVRRIIDLAISHMHRAFGRWMGCLVGLLFAVGGMLVVSLLPAGAYWPGLVGWTALIVLVGNFILKGRYQKVSPDIAEAFIEEGFCPACGYNLFGIDPGPDGLVTCPECAASWGQWRILRAEEVVAPDTALPLREQASAMFFSSPGGYRGRTLQDDSDRPFVPVRTRALRRLRKQATGEYRNRLNLAIQELRFVGVVWRVLLFLVFAGNGTVVVFALTPNPRALPYRPYLLLVPLSQLFLGTSMLFSEFGRSAKKVKAATLAAGLCPACGSFLAENPADDNGLSHCPTCLGAFRLPITSAPYPPRS